MAKGKIAVGLSGGVDSAVTALLLKNQGYNVYGVTMRTWTGSHKAISGNTKSGCYGPDEIEDIIAARNIADAVGIPYQVIDLRKEYQNKVIGPYLKESSQGLTPNPCIFCNRSIKFGWLMKKILKEMSIQRFATGHYAQLIKPDNHCFLARGHDRFKDQSYFLYAVPIERLQHVDFPLGALKKTEVREIAKSIGLGLEHKKESQDFASLGKNSLLKEIKNQPGKIINSQGKTLGTHPGVQYFTIGQRKGLGISTGEPQYVTEMNRSSQTVTIGPRNNLYKRRFTVDIKNWLIRETPDNVSSAAVQIRQSHTASEARIRPKRKGQLDICFLEPQIAITPGQSAVLYDENIVMGGGIIHEIIE